MEEEQPTFTRKRTRSLPSGSVSIQAFTDIPIRTLEQALAAAEVDVEAWEVKSWSCSQWTVPIKKSLGKGKGHEVVQTQQYQVRLLLKPKSSQTLAVEVLIQELRKNRQIRLPSYPKYVQPKNGRRALELSILDPHLGLHCFKPQSDATWSLTECQDAFMSTHRKLEELVKPYRPFEEIVVAFGNDYLHADTVAHTTTAGTIQPEMVSLHEVYQQAVRLMLWHMEQLRALGPKTLHVKLIPGNHDRWTSYTLAHVLKAYYEGAKATNVVVDASSSPYKFWNYGVNLIGFEHGHSVKPIRLAALMANETRLTHWQRARYCEWHLGDQHRKGSGKPSMHEEQGVSVEYLPGLTPPNEWHRLKSFNWQKRGAMAFIYDYEQGPVARLQVNFDSHSGYHMGENGWNSRK